MKKQNNMVNFKFLLGFLLLYGLVLFSLTVSWIRGMTNGW